MKNINNITKLILVVLIFIGTSVQAQNKDGFYLRSAGLSIGYAMPSMDYWNDNYLPTYGWDGTFDGNLTFGADLDVHLYKGILLEVGGSKWSETIENGSIAELKASMTMIDFGFGYSFKELLDSPVYPYANVGMTQLLINNTMNGLGEISDLSEERTGQDYSYYIKVGAMYEVIENFGINLEVKQRFGTYVQQSLNVVTGDVADNDVKINGPQFNLGFRYIF
jgi:hypothetical protein